MAVGRMVVPQFGHGVPNAAFVAFGHFGHFRRGIDLGPRLFSIALQNSGSFFKNDKGSKETLAQFAWTQEERGINHRYLRVNYRASREAR